MTQKKSVSFDGGPVGYKRPPAEHQFKKGVKPPGSGRKKGSKNWSAIIEELLGSSVPVIIDGKRRKKPVKEALLLRAVSQALRGNVGDINRLIDMLTRLAPNKAKEPLEVKFQVIPGDDWGDPSKRP